MDMTTNYEGRNQNPMTEEQKFLGHHIPVGIARVCLKEKLELLEANAYFFRMFGVELSDFSTGALARFGENDRAMYDEVIRKKISAREDIGFEFKTTHKISDNTMWVRVDAHFIEEKDGVPYYLAAFTDITEHKNMSNELEEMKNLYLKAISCSDELIFEYQVKEDVLVYYQLAEDNGSITNQAKMRSGFLENIGKSKDVYPDDLIYFYDLCRDDFNHPFDIRFRRNGQKPGEYTRMRVHATVQKNDTGRPVRIIGTIRPLETVHPKAEKQDKLLKPDELTNLNSRAMAKKCIEEYLQNSTVSMPYALLILDIKDFKRVNKTFGHMFGDNVIIQVADCIIENINKSDIVGRLGGDEFIIFLKNVSENAVLGMCDKLCRSIREIYVGEDMQIDACIGAVSASDPTIPYKNLLKTADNALFELLSEKKSGVKISKEILTDEQELKNAYLADRNLRTLDPVREKRLSELIFELLEQAKDVEKAIETVLALVGEKKGLSRITIASRKEQQLVVTHQWTARGINENRMLDGESILRFIEKISEDYMEEDGMGVIDINAVMKYEPTKQTSLLPAGAKSIMYCDMLEFGEKVGLIAYVDCKDGREWKNKDFKALRTVTRLIAAYTLKARALQKEDMEKG